MGLLLRDAAAHEEAAVAAATAAERAACAQVFGAYMQCSPAVAAGLADTVRQVRARRSSQITHTAVSSQVTWHACRASNLFWAPSLLRYWRMSFLRPTQFL